ncbi:MAG TPA: type II toxin-antitoxin system HicB family antitoxin [Pseudomonas sp.]|uniref:type II toxin-antitoxin system HicB family antitoxin n=1 Tax=Pseudomonas sp. TaxID=306 RepID=UPI002B4649D5|nr:type II toxin-antitoxin system HicB family antitoxin [Pseudomonas sp.]HKS12439.1 type II toxin-antitoxin system HicB family antitoxin [Pseudomonas sp.]
MYDYPLTVHTDENPGLALTCDAIPEFNAAGDDLAEAMAEAIDAMEAALSIYVDQRRTIPPAPEPLDGQPVLLLPSLTVVKIELWNAMMERGMRKADLCRLLGISQSQGDRLVDFLHGSKLEALEQALNALGKRLVIHAEAA